MRIDLVQNEKGKFRLPSLKGIEEQRDTRFNNFYKYYKNEPTDLMEIWEQRKQQGVDPNNFSPSGYSKYMIEIGRAHV